MRRLRTALSQTQVVGLGANTEFLLAIASHPAFLAADLDTGFIQRHETDLPEPAPPVMTRWPSRRSACCWTARQGAGPGQPPPATRTAPGPATMAGA